MANEKIWSKTELAHLKRGAGDHSLDELAQRFHTDTETVRQKMNELGLAGQASSSQTDAALDAFERGIGLLHEGEHAQAADAFEEAVQSADTRQLADRARQYHAIARRGTEQVEAVEDAYLRAVIEKNNGDLDAAIAAAEGLEAAEASERSVYLLASIRALREEDEQALELLARAIELEPRNRVQAYHDPDFASLRGNEAFAGLLDAPRD
ncbi:MAG: hypothetical protein AAGN46_02480 [Acidobacteriota bacterium]